MHVSNVAKKNEVAFRDKNVPVIITLKVPSGNDL
jgi:hypothetical protein